LAGMSEEANRKKMNNIKPLIEFFSETNWQNFDEVAEVVSIVFLCSLLGIAASLILFWLARKSWPVFRAVIEFFLLILRYIFQAILFIIFSPVIIPVYIITKSWEYLWKYFVPDPARRYQLQSEILTWVAIIVCRCRLYDLFWIQTLLILAIRCGK